MGVRLHQWIRTVRRRLGLAIYGKPGRFGRIALVHRWPPPEMKLGPELSEKERLAQWFKDAPFTVEEQRELEEKGVHVYWEGGYD